MGFPGGASGKESTCQFRRFKRCQFYPWVWKFPWRRKWQSIPVFLPGESHGPRSLAGYSPWGHKESDTTKQLNMHTHTHTHKFILEQWARIVLQRKCGVLSKSLVLL